MRRLFWKLFYKAKGEPRNLSGLIIMWARTHGATYSDLGLTEVHPSEWNGEVKWH